MFIHDGKFFWYVTCLEVIDCNGPKHLLIRHKDKGHVLLDIEAVHKKAQVEWVLDQNHNLAAALVPADPQFDIKVVGFDLFLDSADMMPSLSCFSMCYPYGVMSVDAAPVNPFVLSGTIAGIDGEATRIYVTAPSFVHSQGGPLLIVKPVDGKGNAKIGTPFAYLGGIICQNILVPSASAKGSSESSSPISMGVAVPAEVICSMLKGPNADLQRKRALT